MFLDKEKEMKHLREIAVQAPKAEDKHRVRLYVRKNSRLIFSHMRKKKQKNNG